MPESTDFLANFTENLKSRIHDSKEHLFDGLTFHAEISPEEEISHLNQLKTLLDKILSIFYRPHIKVENKEVLLRSELSGKLNHDSFLNTMKDARLWKEKQNEMVPEYVYSSETIDSIDTYENRFISMLVDVIQDELDERSCDSRPLIESIEEHYQLKEVTFGEHSFIHDLRSKSYPYESFFLKGKDKRDEILLLNRKLQRRLRNLKSMLFYKVNHGKMRNGNIMPTNILIHDPLYSYCYRYYVNHYKNVATSVRRREILYLNYVSASLVKALLSLGLLDAVPYLFLDREEILSFESLSFFHDPFTFSFSIDKENIAIRMDVSFGDDNKERHASSYYLIVREKYVKENEKNILLFKDKIVNQYDQVILVTCKNVIRKYHDVLTFSFHDEGNMDLIYDLLSMASNLFEANGEVYSSLCPVCGKEKLIFDGKKFTCEECHSSYALVKMKSASLMWLMSFRKESIDD